MNTENPDSNIIRGGVISNKSDLSVRVFNDPQEFLAVLKSDFKQIARKGATEISETDLKLYSENGADPKGRTAAAIAYRHFDEFKKLSELPKRSLFSQDDPDRGVSEADLALDAKLDAGNIAWIITNHEMVSGAMTLMDAGITGVGAAATAVTSEAVPVAAVLGTLTFCEGLETLRLGAETYNAPAQIRALARHDQALLYGWINGK